MSADPLKQLAARVFGDEEKAESWLHRPNASLSGQGPVDLLNDEIGAAVVREMLEQIDSGMFA
jgi:putative toxin-antitoxin system antitoxin component (TIGR02293 family)